MRIVIIEGLLIIMFCFLINMIVLVVFKFMVILCENKLINLLKIMFFLIFYC